MPIYGLCDCISSLLTWKRASPGHVSMLETQPHGLAKITESVCLSSSCTVAILRILDQNHQYKLTKALFVILLFKNQPLNSNLEAWIVQVNNKQTALAFIFVYYWPSSYFENNVEIHLPKYFYYNSFAKFEFAYLFLCAANVATFISCSKTRHCLWAHPI